MPDAVATREPVFAFDEASHSYTLDGTPIPSVTQILEGAGIVDYSFLPPATRDAALARGRAVHLTTQYDDEGDLDEASVPEQIRPYLEAWRAFRRDTGFTPEKIEHRGWHPIYRYAGTLDRIVTGGSMQYSRVLLDIKTNQAPWWVRLQLAAYAALFEDPRVFWRLAVELRKDATYRVAWAGKPGSWMQDFNDFLAAQRVFRMKQEQK